MSRTLSESRGRIFWRIVIGVGLLVVLAVIVESIMRPHPERLTQSGPVFPELAEQLDDVQLVMVTTADIAYHMVREGDDWILTEKGGYPVRADRMNDLLIAVRDMTYGPRKTQDPAKLDRLGVGDPVKGGTGAIVEIGDGSGTVFAEAVFGTRNDTQYLRLPNENQAFEVSTALPPLHRMDQWLDLKPLALTQQRVQSTTVLRPPSGFFTFDRSSNDKFLLVDPPTGYRITADYLATTVATAAASLSPQDVRRKPSAPMEPSIIHDLTLRSGDRVIVSAYEMDGAYWVDYQVGDALADGFVYDKWLFEISDLEWTNLNAELLDFAYEFQEAP